MAVAGGLRFASISAAGWNTCAMTVPSSVPVRVANQ